MIHLIKELVVLGVAAWLVSIAPFINGQFKTIINYALIVIGAIIVVSFLLGITGSNSL